MTNTENTRRRLLKIRELDLFTPDKRLLLQDFQLEVSTGQVVFIQGGNGSGKTTLIRCILGVWPHYQGKIELSIGYNEIPYLPQIHSPEVHMPLSIKDVLSLSAPKFFEEKVFSMGLLERSQLSYNWNTASGGERKRTLLTRILLNEPRMIFLDEPFNHLDRTSHDLIGNCLNQYVKNKFGTLVLVSHEEKSMGFFEDVSIKRVII